MKSILELMTSEVVKVDVAWTVLQVITVMKDKKIGSVIVEQNGDPVGVFTERDLLTRVDLTRPSGLLSVTIDEVMTPAVIAVDAEQSLVDVVSTMRQHNVRHLPVTRDGQVVGLVSSRDLLEHYQEYLEETAAKTQAALETTSRNSKLTNWRFSKVFSRASIAIVETDKANVISVWNQFAETVFDIDCSLQGLPMSKFFEPEQWANVIRRNTIQTTEDEYPFHFETEMIRDGQPRLRVGVSVGAAADEYGDLTGYIYIIAPLND